MPFYKFVPRVGKQEQINSGKLSTYQPGVKQIARDVPRERKQGKKKHKMTREKNLGSFRSAVARNLLHPRMVSRTFAAVYLPLLLLPRDEFRKGYCLLSSNREGANDVTVEAGTQNSSYGKIELRLLSFSIIFGV